VTPPVVEVSDLRIELVGLGVDVVDEIELRIHAGEVLGLVGESGSGKTTVGMALLGHVRGGGRRSGGTVAIDGRSLDGLGEGELRKLRGGTVAYIPQDPGTALNPALRIGTQLREMLDAHASGWSDEERTERLRGALEEVALPSDDAFLRRYPHQLSGGQQQRVAIAMAFANRPQVIVCDEPTTGLDVTTQARVLETVRDLCRSHRVAALYVTHDLAVVAELADRVAVMYAGRIVESGPRERIFSGARHPYTRRLLRAVPDIAGKRTVVGIPGRAALPGNRPSGCFFHPRCPLADEQSRAEFPPVTDLGGGHTVRCFHHEAAAQSPDPEGAGQLGPRETDEQLVLTVRDLDAHYGASHALFRIDLDVHRRECLALVGESGSGKTTLARCASGLHSDYTGQVRLEDDPLPPAARKRSRDARRRIQYIFQNPYASLNPRRTIGQTIARQLQLFHPGSRADTSRRVGECLERVALSAGAARRFPDQLSGGERQRVAIARALAAEPTVLICDEVTSALDVSVQAAIIELLGELRREMGLSMLFITHDLALIRTIADRVAVMHRGRIVEQGSVEEILTTPGADYTRELLANTPSIEVALGHAAPPA
jgi:oligopeptide/dipeptide ABC transporter ATP-binding protein